MHVSYIRLVCLNFAANWNLTSSVHYHYHYINISQWTLNPSRFIHGSSMVIKPIVYTSTSAVYYEMSHINSVFHKWEKASNT